MTNSEMEIRGYKPADETYYEYKDEEERPRGKHYDKVDDEDIDPSTIGRYAETKDFKHWPFKVGNAMTQNTPDDVQHPVDTGGYMSKWNRPQQISYYDRCQYFLDENDVIYHNIYAFTESSRVL